MKLLDIPGEVLTHHLFPLLEPNDIVRLRRVCKPLKLLADDHLRLTVRNKRLLLVGENCEDYFSNEDDEGITFMDLKVCDEVISMEALVNMECHLPVAKVAVALNFDQWDDMFKEGEEYEYSEWTMKEFLEKYGRQIAELKLTRLSVPLRKEKEIAFFEGLPNLTRLTIDGLETQNLLEKNDDNDKFLFPETFKNLKHTKISKLFLSRENVAAEKEYFWKLVEHCQALEVLVYPWPWFKDNELNMLKPSLTTLSFHNLGGLLQNGRLPSLKYYDLHSSYLDDPAMEASTFAELCAVCLRHDVKLVNVTTVDLHDHDLMVLQNIGRSTVSLEELSIECFMVPFPNLEKLQVSNILTSLESRDGQTTWRQFGIPMWPKLRLVDFLMSRNSPFKQLSQDLFHILFEARTRPTVTHLIISNTEPANPVKKYEAQIHPRLLQQVAWSCFNLRKVQFRSWNGTNKALSIFWEKLPLLEDICIENSPEVGNSAFVGKDLENPIFLQLKNLKRLCLLNVHKMEKITDTVFKLVFRHMKIQSFHLTSWDIDDRADRNKIIKIKSITKEGIRSLLTSNFATHLERFPFNTWMLDDMDEEEFHQLRDEFRSAQMH